MWLFQSTDRKTWARIPAAGREGSFFFTEILNLMSHTGWMGSIDLHISRQNPSIETTTSG